MDGASGLCRPVCMQEGSVSAPAAFKQADVTRFLCAVAAFSSFLATINYVNENYALAALQAGYAGVVLAGALIVRLAVRS